MKSKGKHCVNAGEGSEIRAIELMLEKSITACAINLKSEKFTIKRYRVISRLQFVLSKREPMTVMLFVIYTEEKITEKYY